MEVEITSVSDLSVVSHNGLRAVVNCTAAGVYDGRAFVAVQATIHANGIDEDGPFVEWFAVEFADERDIYGEQPMYRVNLDTEIEEQVLAAIMRARDGEGVTS